eukprot:GFUD01133072.1.p1 GENE.GFUD01133072.1~~GFUD01133072.1.p1  ORF type:complete len:926 (+),score=328.00 GFUD01133072.1:114-2891(+)
MSRASSPLSLATIEQEILAGGLENVGSGRGVMARPAGNNSLTFFMNDEDVDEEEEEAEMEGVAEDVTIDNLSMELSSLDTSQTSQASVEEETSKQRERVLTDKYLAGQLSFKDFVSEINGEEDDEEELVSDDDEEWRPPGKRVKPGKTSRATSPESAKNKSNRESFEEELEQSQKSQLKRKKKVGGGTRRKRLDPALQGLMGEANLRFARGDAETAERMCMEVIRQDPTAPEPFQTLATLYEEQGEIERSLQFGLLAAHLAPQDGEEWARLADMSLEQGEMVQAADCYRKAVDADPGVARYHFTRAGLLERMGDKKGALRCYKRLLADLNMDQGEEFMQATKAIATLLHDKEDLEEAKKYFEEAFSRHGDCVTSEDVNLFLELLITLNQSQQALTICCEWCSVQFSADQSHKDLSNLEPEDQLAAFTELLVPEDLAADIRAKLVVILVGLRASHLTTELCEMFLEAETDQFGDLMLDMGEAMLKEKLWTKALPFYEKLVESERYGEAAVWLQLAECQANTNLLEMAEKSYRKVVELAPHVYQARLQLSLIMHKLGRAEDALDTLRQDEQQELLNPHLMFERCQMLLAENKIEEFLSKGKLLFSRHFVTIRNKDELHAISSAKKMSSKNKALNEVRNFRCEPLTEEFGPEFGTTGKITVEQEFGMFRRMCEILFEQERYVELQRVTFSALGSPVFTRKAEIIKECEFLCLLSSFFNGDSYHAYNLVRELVIKNVNNNSVWNLFNLVIMRADDVRHNRFLMRLMSRNPDNLALGILNGHNCLVAGTYKYSLGEYMSAFKADSSNPLVALMLGLTFCHMACQKFSAKKHSLVVQACSFLNTYKSLRGDCQEVNYNIGRAMHQLSLLPAALFYYKKGLEMGPSIKQEEGKDGHNMFDLSREIAFNMSLIYSSSGNMDLARMYTEKYITV